MSTHATTTQGAAPSAVDGNQNWLQRAWRFNQLLTISILLQAALVPIFVVALLMDQSLITGMPRWIKPFKFALSGSIYAATFLWMLTLVQGRKRTVLWLASLTGLALLVETIIIDVQVIRGAASHFNVASTVDGVLFSIMGTFITILAVCNLVLAFWLLFQKIENPLLQTGIRWGVLLSAFGVSMAYLMTAGPTPLQMEALQAGQAVSAIGAHAVGVADGGPGLPFFGWSTTGGDLRIGHFVGLHGMQVLPFLAFLLARRPGSAFNRRRDIRLLHVAGATYLGIAVLVTWQALRSQPLIAPDGQTWLAAGVLTLLSLAGMLWALRTQHEAVASQVIASGVTGEIGRAGRGSDAPCPTGGGTYPSSRWNPFTARDALSRRSSPPA